jgi:ABC-type antimicrobial peptide transport system permease subunit
VTIDGVTHEIVGVVGNARYLELREPMPPTLYFHWGQQSDTLLLRQNVRLSQFTIRSDTPPGALAMAVREMIREAAPSLAITKIWTLEEQVNASIARERMLSLLSGFFACLGLLLAAIGLYGVMAYTVARRTSEIGIRMALGADASRISRMVLHEALLLTVGGIATGLVAALLVSRSLATLLYGLTPGDPLTAVAVAAVMMLTGVAAACIPSQRAVRIDPTMALRSE